MYTTQDNATRTGIHVRDYSQRRGVVDGPPLAPSQVPPSASSATRMRAAHGQLATLHKRQLRPSQRLVQLWRSKGVLLECTSWKTSGRRGSLHGQRCAARSPAQHNLKARVARHVHAAEQSAAGLSTAINTSQATAKCVWALCTIQNLMQTRTHVASLPKATGSRAVSARQTAAASYL